MNQVPPPSPSPFWRCVDGLTRFGHSMLMGKPSPGKSAFVNQLIEQIRKRPQ